MLQWVGWGLICQNWVIKGPNWVKRGSNVGQVEGSVGHVGPMGHVGHWASEFMSNGYGATGFYHMGLMGHKSE